MERGIELLCTLGPASLSVPVIQQLSDRGVSLFRLNLSHTPLEAILPALELVRQATSVPLCIDTEGAQVRCGPVVGDELVLHRGQELRLTRALVVGDERELTLWPAAAFEGLEPGHTVAIGWDGVVVEVTASDPEGAMGRVLIGGRIGSNKAVVITPAPAHLPALTEKDRAAIELARRAGVRHFALSFANSCDDVMATRRLLGPDDVLISKIESRAGVRDMDRIIRASDAVLLDRGDLSREVPIEHVPFVQREVVARARRAGTPVYVATNLLESMVMSRRPTVAEINDIMNTLLDGADGLVLAAETAIGRHAVETVDMVQRVVGAFHGSRAHLAALLGESRALVPLA